MCGIWAYYGLKYKEEFKKYFEAIQHRGPDNTRIEKVKSQVYLGFHRLSINGIDDGSNQPIHLGKLSLICNGEIYNYKNLAEKYNFEYQTGSDCEVILHMYRKFGIQKTCKKLDGVFAFVIYDGEKDQIYAARDPYGVRQMFISFDKDKTDVGICSEAKGLLFHQEIQQFVPGSWWTNTNKKFHQYFYLEYPLVTYQSEDQILQLIREKFIKAVKKRMMSERKIGGLLSGGLDSSLIVGVLAKFYKNPKDLETFSIGMKGSPDLHHAQIVADYLGTKHHSVEVSENVFLTGIEKVIQVLGSFDVTTIRASVGHWIICQYIKDHSDVKVIYSGEYADEQNLSYLYGMNAPSAYEFQKESIRLLQFIGYFDNLRGDHCISNAGLEARVPFADHEFMSFMMSLNPLLKMFGKDKMEKYLLRKAFSGQNVIPEEVLWRRKNGFSDSVSQKERSWSTIIQEYVDTLVTDQEFNDKKDDFIHCPPKTKEAYYYRKIYQTYYPSNEYLLTPFQWLPKWCGDIVDPSARVLNIYEAD